jgi:hypothetical protein
LEDNHIGWGWSHNFNISAKPGSNGFSILGDGSPVDAVASIVKTFISLDKLMAFLSPSRKIKSITTLDLQNYKRRLQKSYGSVFRLNLHISIMKALFHWARENDILETSPILMRSQEAR